MDGINVWSEKNHLKQDLNAQTCRKNITKSIEIERKQTVIIFTAKQ